MSKLPEALDRLYERYEEVDRSRGDFRYRHALESLVEFYLRIGNDAATLEEAIDTLIEDYEEKQDRIVKLLHAQDFQSLQLVVKELKSSIRHVVDETVLESACEVERASGACDLPRTYGAWSVLHEKLCPVFMVMRQLRRS